MDRRCELKLPGLAFGADYNPDQWPEEIWHEDVALMQEAGVNLVTLPVFSWPALEPERGRYEFGWLERAIDLLWAHGLYIDLATATATPPAWLVRAHPEVLPQDRDGVRLEFGSRQGYCPSSPVFREHAVELTTALARHFGRHEALALWHVSNEYGDELSRCWCEVSADHFRRWLQERYATLDTLNDAWGTTCWGQTYSAWRQIEPPRRATGPINPAQQVDFERFSSDALLGLFTAEADVLREITPQVPVTTNFMAMFRELDHWDLAAAEDLVTLDSYPDPADPRSHVGAGLSFGLMRGLKQGRPWLLLEQAPSAVSWREVNVAKPPGQMAVQSLQALAHGSDGAMFFQWRQARFGPEKFHSAMLGHRGSRSRTFGEVKALGAQVQALAAVKGTYVRTHVAMVVDWDSWWGLSAPDSLPSSRLSWLGQARAWHAALAALGQAVDAVPAGGPYGRYAVIVVPNLYAVTDAQAEQLASFVREGGTLVVGPFSGVVDHCERVHPGGAPGPLRSLLGVEIDEWWPLPDGTTVDVTSDLVGRGTDGAQNWAASVWSEWLEPSPDAVVIASYTSGDLAGRPAVVRRADVGTAYYVSAVLSADALVGVLCEALQRAGVVTSTSRARYLEVVTRSDGSTDHTFVMNHGRTAVSVGALPVDARPIIGPPPVEGRIALRAFETSVLAHPTTEKPPAASMLATAEPLPSSHTRA